MTDFDKSSDGEDKSYMALKYPGFHKWRDLDAALKAGGRWPSGALVRLSDPEMKPRMDAIMEEMKNDKEKAKNFLQNLGLHKPSET